MSRFGLSDTDLNKLVQTFSHYPDIEQVLIYGSRAKGNYRPGSDIDLTVMGALEWHAFQQLEAELDDLLLPYQIDLSLHAQIDNIDLLEHIERVGQLIYPSKVDDISAARG